MSHPARHLSAAADGWSVYQATGFRFPGGLASDRRETSARDSVSLPATRPPFLCWSVAGGPGTQAGIPIDAAIVVELVVGLSVVTVRAGVAAIVAGDVGPVRPGRSPAGGQAGAVSRPTDQLGVAIAALQFSVFSFQCSVKNRLSAEN